MKYYINIWLIIEDYLKPLWYNWRGDELIGGHFLVQLVVGAFVKQNQVVQFVPGEMDLSIYVRYNRSQDMGSWKDHFRPII